MKLRHILLSAALLTSISILAAPKYVFYFIGDGMGPGHVMAAQTYNRVVLGNDTPLLMMQFPYGGLLTTYSASSTVTDSAAAGTALATGNKTRNGMLGVTPDTTAVQSIASVLHDAGWGVALVTNMSPDDATPGAFYAHVPSRRQFYDIGRQAAESGYEFIAGARWRGAYDRDGNPTGLTDYIRSHNVDLVTSYDQALKSDSRRVFLYSDSPLTHDDLGYAVDSVPGILKLPQMTATAIEHMKKVSPDRFVMMVEGGNIDHLGHGNDGGGVAIEVINFNHALAEAYRFYLDHPDETVIIVTADHETGGLSIGNNTVGYTSRPDYVPYQNMSKDRFSAAVKEMLADNSADHTWESFKEFTADHTGLWNVIPVKERHENRLRELYDTTFGKRQSLADEKTLYASFNALANEVYTILNKYQGYGWTTYGHSGNPVPVYAIGNGMEVFGRWLDNTDITPMLLGIINE